MTLATIVMPCKEAPPRREASVSRGYDSPVPRGTVIVACAAACALAIQIAPASAREAPLDRNPSTLALTSSLIGARPLLSTSFVAAQPGEDRLVSATVVVDRPTTRMLLVVSGHCRPANGESNQEFRDVRNIWPGRGGVASVDVTFLATARIAGRHDCQTLVRTCDVGRCDGQKGTGTARVVTRRESRNPHTVMEVSDPLPPWAQQQRLASGQSGDIPVQSGSSRTVRSSFILDPDWGPVDFDATLSVTNCIKPTFPRSCAAVRKRALHGSSQIETTAYLRQVGTDGSVCATTKAKSVPGSKAQLVTWEEHHATLRYRFRDFRVQSSARCTPTVEVVIEVRVARGNGIVIEPGASRSLKSWTTLRPAR